MTLPIYLVSPPLGERLRPNLAADLIASVLDGASVRGGPCLVVAPAGLACVEDDDAALEVAETMRTLARRAGVALVFGVDVGPPKPGSGRIFACYGGAPVLWPAQTGRGFPADVERRIMLIDERSVLPLYASEALDVMAPRRIASLDVSLTLVLSHGGATQRWAAPLARIEKSSQVVVSLHHGGGGRGYATAALGASWLTVHDDPRVEKRAA